MKYEIDKQYIYREMGVEWLVTLIHQEKDKGMNKFKLRVDKVISMGSMSPAAGPKVGTILDVSYQDGFQHYVGWDLNEV